MSLGEPTEQFGMTGDKFVNRRLERRLQGTTVLLFQERNELFHGGPLRRGELRNKLSEICWTHVSLKKVYTCDKLPATRLNIHLLPFSAKARHKTGAVI
jgi:hypothetical protein